MKSLVLTTYFTTQKDPQRNVFHKPNDENLSSNWILSTYNIGLNGIVFHDCLSNYFINKQPKNLTFIYIKPNSKHSLNDIRYIIWLDYIINNTEIEYFFTTDMFDVEFNKNPFEIISDKYDIYVGSNRECKISQNNWLVENMNTVYKKTFFPDFEDANAGIIGGNRKNIIKLFENMKKDILLNESPKDLSMAIFNKNLYETFEKEKILIGYPITSKFKKYEKHGNFYIKHK